MMINYKNKQFLFVTDLLLLKRRKRSVCSGQDDEFSLDSTRGGAAPVGTNNTNSGGGSVNLLGLILISLIGFVRRKIYA
ncbi:MAG: GlyGly-CTERM sorting domain-containing protein [Gammaproteobacteria bacterium]|nr:GlyGly-CTERM sorting domain-containing protein [Gammaproteobacteria bacterium]